MTFTVPRKTQILWQIRIAFVLAVSCAVLVVFCRISLWFLLPTAIVLSIGSAFIFGYIPMFCGNYQITLDDVGICITKGVFITEIIVIPHPKLAFVKSISTPVLNLMNLRFIMLKVSRGWIFVPEMDAHHINQVLAVLHSDKKSF